jgi:hypothetical protein
MTFQELLSEINSLPLEERLILLETLTRGLRSELGGQPHSMVPVGELRGRLKPAGNLPADLELDDAYTLDLIEKYT